MRRASKNSYYESPCSVTGTGQHTGSEGNLRVDMHIGTWKDWDMEPVTGCEMLGWKVCSDMYITILYPVERGGTVPKKPLRKRSGGGIATSRQ